LKEFEPESENHRHRRRSHARYYRRQTQRNFGRSDLWPR
jgi:hypothetical protein